MWLNEKNCLKDSVIDVLPIFFLRKGILGQSLYNVVASNQVPFYVQNLGYRIQLGSKILGGFTILYLYNRPLLGTETRIEFLKTALREF